MESQHFVNDKQLFETVKNYISDPNSNRPLLVIGHTGIGKTAIIERAIENCGVQVDFQTLNMGPAKDQHNKCIELVDAYNLDDNKHLIIELTCEYSGIFRKTIKQLGDKVFWAYCREDVNDYLTWAREAIKQDAQLSNEEKAIQKSWLGLDVATQYFQNDNVQDAIMHLEFSIKNLLIATLDDELVHNYVNHVNSLLWKYKDKKPSEIMCYIGTLEESFPFLNK